MVNRFVIRSNLLANVITIDPHWHELQNEVLLDHLIVTLNNWRGIVPSLDSPYRTFYLKHTGHICYIVNAFKQKVLIFVTLQVFHLTRGRLKDTGFRNIPCIVATEWRLIGDSGPVQLLNLWFIFLSRQGRHARLQLQFLPRFKHNIFVLLLSLLATVNCNFSSSPAQWERLYETANCQKEKPKPRIIPIDRNNKRAGHF
jgi:hypothetical protein